MAKCIASSDLPDRGREEGEAWAASLRCGYFLCGMWPGVAGAAVVL